MSTNPVLGSLCTGYGGLDLGVLAALGGGRIAWCADPDPHVQQKLLLCLVPGRLNCVTLFSPAVHVRVADDENRLAACAEPVSLRQY